MARNADPQRQGRTAEHGDDRPDEAIWEDLHEQLTGNPDLDATEIEIRVDVGEVTLAGRVDSRDARWLAEEIARAVPGVVELHNRLKVARL